MPSLALDIREYQVPSSDEVRNYPSDAVDAPDLLPWSCGKVGAGSQKCRSVTGRLESGFNLVFSLRYVSLELVERATGLLIRPQGLFLGQLTQQKLPFEGRYRPGQQVQGRAQDGGARFMQLAFRTTRSGHSHLPEGSHFRQND